jgi:hypothetical protein
VVDLVKEEVVVRVKGEQAPKKGRGGRKVVRWTLRKRKMRKRMRRFLPLFMKSGSVKHAAKEAGLGDVSLVYRWVKNDAAFAESFKAAKELLKKQLDEEGKRKVKAGTRRVLMYYQGLPICMPGGRRFGAERQWSDAVLMFRLKQLKPEMYG